MGIKVSRFLKDLWLNVDRANEAGIVGKTLTIQRVYMKRVGNEDKLIVAFQDVERHLPLNQTNLRALMEGCGGVDDALEWIGAKVELYVDDSIEVRGEQQSGLRVQVTSYSPRKESK